MKDEISNIENIEVFNFEDNEEEKKNIVDVSMGTYLNKANLVNECFCKLIYNLTYDYDKHILNLRCAFVAIKIRDCKANF